MERFRSFIKSAFSYPRLLRTTHPVTAVGVIATTFMFAIYSFINATRDYNSTKSWETPLDIFMHLSLAVLFFAVFALCLESIRPSWSKAVKYAVFAAFAILSLLMSFITADFIDKGHARYKGFLVNLRENLGTANVALYIGGLLALAVLLGVYFSYSHDIHQHFNDHVMNAYSKIFFTSIIYGVIQLGVLFLTLIVTLLLYDDAFEYLPPVLIIINGLFFMPAVICALTKQNERANMFMQVLVRYVMLTIVLLAFAIIYIYILKLIITRSVPSNSVYAILTALFIVSMIVTYMCTVFEDKGFLQKFAYNAPLIFAPFVLMQCYTVFVRIGQYGLTPMRYFGVVFILFEIVYIVYYTICHRREHEIAGRNLLLIICAFIIVAIFLPGISGRSLSNSLARHTLRSYLQKSGSGEVISEKEYMRANAAYGFLYDSDFGKGRVEKYFASLDEDTIRNLKEKAREASKIVSADEKARAGQNADDVEKHSWFSSDIVDLVNDAQIDISGFDRMTLVEIRTPEGSGKKADGTVDTSDLYVYVNDEEYRENGSVKPLMSVDLSDYCRRFNEAASDNDVDLIDYDQYNDRIRSMSIIDINETARLYITNADIARNSAGETVNVEITGYLLTSGNN